MNACPTCFHNPCLPRCPRQTFRRAVKAVRENDLKTADKEIDDLIDWMIKGDKSQPAAH